MTEPNLRVRVLARALRELRERARMTQQEAGDRLRFTNRKMSRIETGQLPSYHELQAMLDVYGLVSTDWAPYLAMWERAKEKGWWHTYGLADRGYIPLESEASVIRSFQLGMIPGLLQTPAYTQALLDHASMPMAAVENLIQIRQRRQQRLTAEEPLVLHSIFDVTTLERRLPCMREQLAHLVMVAELDNVTFQVLPASVPVHVGLSGSFSLISFPSDPDIAYVEHIAGAVQLEKADELRACKVGFEMLASSALGHDESVALVDRMASEL